MLQQCEIKEQEPGSAATPQNPKTPTLERETVLKLKRAVNKRKTMKK